jgi:putative peptidoglycan lipid II flippase
MGPAVIGVAAVQISVFVNTRFAGSLGDGPVSELSYAFRLFFLPLGMFGVALATVTTTSVSEAAASGDRNELARRAARSIQAGLMLVSASAVGLWVLAEPVVTFIYRHGQTTAQDVQSISACLQGYVIGLLPYSLVKIFAPAFYAVDKPRLPLLASAVGVGVNVGFNALTYRELGAPGIALGTSLGAVANYVVLRLSFTRQIATLPSDGRGRQLATLLVSNGLLAAVVFGAWSGIALGLGQLAPLGDLARTALIGAGLALVIMLGFAVFTGVMRALDYPDADVLWSLPGRAFRRFRRRR